MKSYFKASTLALILSGTVMVVGHLATADGFGPRDFRGGFREQRREDERSFALGVCVGQAIAQRGLTIATPVAGQPPEQLDSATEAALKEATDTCRSAMDPGASPSPEPSAVASTTPDPTSSPTTGD